MINILCIYLVVLIICSSGSIKKVSKITGKYQQTNSITYANFGSPFYFDVKASNDQSLCILPFSRAGNLILIKAKADTIEGNFILDTGAPNLVLNITYFRDYPVTNTSDESQTNIAGTASSVVKTQVKNFYLGTFNYKSLDADLIQLGHIENSKGVKILGLLGLQLFKECELIIDYQQSVIYLKRISKNEAGSYKSDLLKDTSAYRTVPIEFIDDKIIARTQLAGKTLKFAIDCAAESNVLDSRLSNKVFENVEITRRVLLAGAGSKKIEALYGNVKNMKMGNEDIGTLPVLITNLENTCFSANSCINGVLGFDFLSLHKIGFNFVTHKMYIWK